MIRLLVADDDAFVRELIAECHARGDFPFGLALAPDGDEALALLRAGGAEALLTDLCMPGMDGFALVDALRAEPATAATPVWMFTSAPGPQPRRAARARGTELLEKWPSRAGLDRILRRLLPVLAPGHEAMPTALEGSPPVKVERPPVLAA